MQHVLAKLAAYLSRLQGNKITVFRQVSNNTNLRRALHECWLIKFHQIIGRSLIKQDIVPHLQVCKYYHLSLQDFYNLLANTTFSMQLLQITADIVPRLQVCEYYNLYGTTPISMPIQPFLCGYYHFYADTTFLMRFLQSLQEYFNLYGTATMSIWIPQSLWGCSNLYADTTISMYLCPKKCLG